MIGIESYLCDGETVKVYRNRGSDLSVKRMDTIIGASLTSFTTLCRKMS